MSFSDFLENELLDHAFGAAAYTPATTLYFAASSADPGESGAGIVEPSGGSYARVAVTNNLTNFPAASGGAKANGVSIGFPVATADWLSGVGLTHVGIFDASSGGNFLGRGAIAVPKAILNGDQLIIPIGDLDITLT